MIMCAAFLRDRIVAFTSPGIAPKNSPDGQGAPYKKSSFLQCLYSVMRTAGAKTAYRWHKWRYCFLIKAHQQYKGQYDYFV
jgi:hypothetical protein